MSPLGAWTSAHTLPGSFDSLLDLRPPQRPLLGPPGLPFDSLLDLLVISDYVNIDVHRLFQFYPRFTDLPQVLLVLFYR